MDFKYIENNISLHDIHRVSEKRSEKTMRKFLQGYRHFYKKYRDNNKGYIKEKQLETDIFLVI